MLMSHWAKIWLSPTSAPPIFRPTQWVIHSVSITPSAVILHKHSPTIVSLLFMIVSFLSLSLFIFLTNPESLCYNIPTLHHCPYPSFIPSIRWFQVIVHSILGWLANCHMSWPLQVYRVVTIVQFAPQLCNLRTLLHPSQSSVLL